MASNNRKKSSPAGIVFALLMLVVIVIALVIVLRSCSMSDGGDESAPPATEAVTDVTEPGGSTAPESPGAAPSETPAAPSPTLTPTPTPTSTPTPTPAANASGTMRSDTGTALNIVADWTLSGTTLSVNVSAESYSLRANGAWHGGWVTVGGQTYYFDTKDINYDGPGQGTNPLGSVTISGVNPGVSVEVAWHFQGTYGGTELETITASGVIA